MAFVCFLGGCQTEVFEPGRTAEQFWNKTLAKCGDQWLKELLDEKKLGITF
jgi:hypothetical protein